MNVVFGVFFQTVATLKDVRLHAIVIGTACSGFSTCAMVWGAEFLPASWSPDGRDMVFLASPRAESDLPDDWLFGVSPGSQPSSSAIGIQIWLARPETGQARPIAGPFELISTPTWSPDGNAVLFLTWQSRASVARTDEGEANLCRWASGKIERLQPWPMSLGGSKREDFARRTCVPAPNGLTWAIDLPDDSGIALYSITLGKVTEVLPNARLASWSPDSRNLAYLHDRDPAGVWLRSLDDAKSARRIIPGARIRSPAVWDQGCTTIWTLRASSSDPTADANGGDAHRLEVVRYSVPEQTARVVARPRLQPELNPASARGSFAIQEEQEFLCTTVCQARLQMAIEWMDWEGQTLRRPWHPLDSERIENAIPLGGLAFSPSGKTLAFRFGRPGWTAPVATLDTETNVVRLVPASDGMAVDAAACLALATCRLVSKVPADAPSPFLSAGRQGGSQVSTDRLGRFSTSSRDLQRPARANLDLFDRPFGIRRPEGDLRENLRKLTGPALELLNQTSQRSNEPSIVRRLIEVRLLLHYARREYASALAAARHLEQLPEPKWPHPYILATKTVEAQCLFGLGQSTQARSILLAVAKERRYQTEPAVVDRAEARLLGLDEATPYPKTTAESDPLRERIRQLLETPDREDRKESSKASDPKRNP